MSEGYGVVFCTFSSAFSRDTASSFFYCGVSGIEPEPTCFRFR